MADVKQLVFGAIALLDPSDFAKLRVEVIAQGRGDTIYRDLDVAGSIVFLAGDGAAARVSEETFVALAFLTLGSSIIKARDAGRMVNLGGDR